MADKSSTSEKRAVFHRRKSVPNVHRALKPSKADKNPNPATQANHSKPEQTDETGMLGHELATDEKTPFEQICTLFAASLGPVPMEEIATHYSNNLKKAKTLLTVTDMLYAVEEPLTPFTLETLPRPAHEPFALLSHEDLESMASDAKSSPTLATFLKVYSIPEYTAIHFRTAKPATLNVRPRKTSVRSVSHSNLNKMKIKIPDNPLGNEDEPHKNSARDKDKEKSPRRLEKQTSGDRDHRRASEGPLSPTRADANTCDNRQSDSRPATGRTVLRESQSNRSFHSRGKEEKRHVKSPECTSDDGKEHDESDRSEPRAEKERERSERAREREERKESDMLNRLASPRKAASEDRLDRDDLLDSAQRQSRSRLKDREHARKPSHPVDDEIDLDKLSVPRRDDRRDEKALSSKGWSFLKKGKEIAVEETKLSVAPNAMKKIIQKEFKDSKEASQAGSLPSKEVSQADLKMPDVPDRSLLHEELLAATARLLTPRFIKDIQSSRGEDDKSLAGTSASTVAHEEASIDSKALAGKSEASDSKSSSQHILSLNPEEPSVAVLGLDASLAYYLFSLKDLRVPSISGAFLLQFSLHNLGDGRKVSEDFNVVWHDGAAVHPELAALSCAFQTADVSSKLYIIARVITPLSMEPEPKEDKKTKTINKKARRQSAASIDLTNEPNSEYSMPGAVIDAAIYPSEFKTLIE